MLLAFNIFAKKSKLIDEDCIQDYEQCCCRQIHSSDSCHQLLTLEHLELLNSWASRALSDLWNIKMYFYNFSEEASKLQLRKSCALRYSVEGMPRPMSLRPLALALTKECSPSCRRCYSSAATADWSRKGSLRSPWWKQRPCTLQSKAISLKTKHRNVTEPRTGSWSEHDLENNHPCLVAVVRSCQSAADMQWPP